jgi:ferredoxin, 2Fe-2S
MYTVKFRNAGTTDGGLVLKKMKPGQSLLEIAIDHSINLEHECGAMCSCGTCHVYVDKGNEHLEFKSLREQHQLARVANTNERSRLACQCVLLAGKGDIIAVLPESHILTTALPGKP